MNVHDRGTMKWVSLMLPEHVEMLKKAFVERKEKPILDEQKMIEIDRILKYAFENQLPLKMTYFENGNFSVSRGKLAKIDQQRGYIVLCNGNGGDISLADLIDVEII